MAKKILLTGSSGLIGSQVCIFFSKNQYTVCGIDNNQRAVFFDHQGDTLWNPKRLSGLLKNYNHFDIDIHNRTGILDLNNLTGYFSIAISDVIIQA